MKFLFILSILISSQSFAEVCWKATSPVVAKWNKKMCFDSMSVHAASESDVSIVVSQGLEIWKLPVVVAVGHGGFIKFKAEGSFKSDAKYQTQLEYFGSVNQNGNLDEFENCKVRVLFTFNGKPECAKPNEEGKCEVWYDYAK